jgi:predicted SAM-dependent methyltransferase
MEASARIPCLALVYFDLDAIRKRLNSLFAEKRRLELTVIENPSEHSTSIRPWLERMTRCGLIERCVLFDENIAGNAIAETLEKQVVSLANSPYVILTDGDLVCTQDWLGEVLNALDKNPDLFACGVSLQADNLPLKTFPDANTWIPADIAVAADYIEARTGIHLLAMRTRDLSAFLEYRKSNDLAFMEDELHKYCYDVRKMKWGRTKTAQARHLTWDSYADAAHPYTVLKTAISHEELWRHARRAGFKVVGNTNASSAPALLMLHVGSGSNRFEGWINIDLNTPEADLNHDLRLPLPFPDSCADYIHNEHFIEHLTIPEGLVFMRECFRVLKPGGVLRTATPDLRYVAFRYFFNWKNQDWIHKYGYEWLQTPAEMMNLVFREWEHKFIYDAEEMSRRLREAGFARIKREKLNASKHAQLRNRETRKDSRLILEATKA